MKRAGDGFRSRAEKMGEILAADRKPDFRSTLCLLDDVIDGGESGPHEQEEARNPADDLLVRQDDHPGVIVTELQYVA